MVYDDILMNIKVSKAGMCQDPDWTTEARNLQPGPEFATRTGKKKNPDQTRPDKMKPGPDVITRTGGEIETWTGSDWKK